MTRRPRTVLLVSLGVLVFLVVSVELARFISSVTSERNAVYALLEDQARGDAAGVLGRLDDCTGACATQTRATVARLATPGKPKILNYESPTKTTLGTRTGRARVAWAIVSRNGRPVVQCVTVRHTWSFVSGSTVSLRRLSAPIDNEAGC